MVGLDGAGKDLDAVGSILDLPIDAGDGFGDGVGLWHGDVVFGEIALDVDGGLNPKGVADSQNVRAKEFASFNL